MAQTTLLPKRTNFNESIKKSQKTLLNTQTNLTNLSKLLKERKENREKITSSILTERKKREYAAIRQEAEDELEAKRVASSPNISSGVNLVPSSGSFIDRIVNTLGYLAAGWILRNLPTWEGMAKEFIARLQEAGRIIGSFVTGAIRVFQASYSLITGAIQNLKNFDLTDSSNNIRNSFDELVDSINDMGSELEAGVKLITTPLTQTTEDGRQVGSYSREEIPALGSTSTDMGAYAESATSSGSSSNKAVYGTKEQKALLDAIAFAEGNTSWSTWAGYQKHGPDDLTGLTIRQVHDLQTSFMRAGKTRKTGSAVVGRYQFKDLLYHAKGAGLNPETDKFSPANQDRMAIKAAERRGVTADMLAKEGLSTKVADLLAPEWASFPYSPKGGRSFYGQGFKDIKSLQSVYSKSLGSATQQSQTPSSPTRATSTPTTNLIPITGTTGASQRSRPLSVPYSPFASNKGNPVLTSGFGMRWGKMHKGYDISANEGTPLYAYFPGTVTHANKTDKWGSGYGYWVVWKDDIYGSYHFFGHLQQPPSVNVGQKFNQGTQLGLVGNTGSSTGPHLHWEISKNAPAPNGQFTSVEDPGKWLAAHPMKEISKQQPQAQVSPQAQTPPPAQISQTPSQQSKQQLSQALTPERKAQDIVAVIPEQQAQPPPTQMPQPSIGGPSPSVSMATLLNNFMKQKLLLDLSYV